MHQLVYWYSETGTHENLYRLSKIVICIQPASKHEIRLKNNSCTITRMRSSSTNWAQNWWSRHVCNLTFALYDKVSNCYVGCYAARTTKRKKFLRVLKRLLTFDLPFLKLDVKFCTI